MLSKETLSLCLDLLSQVRIAPTDPGADENWPRLVTARQELRAALQTPDQPELPSTGDNHEED
jgi:hypothetical protein